jgi:hypothetical protein
MPAEQSLPTRALRVGLIAADPLRRGGLTAIVTHGGHQIVDACDEADAVLVDGAVVSGSDAPPRPL